MSLLLIWPIGLAALVFAGMSTSNRTKCAQGRRDGNTYAAANLAAKSRRYRSISAALSLIGIVLILVVFCLILLGQQAETTFTPVGP